MTPFFYVQPTEFPTWALKENKKILYSNDQVSISAQKKESGELSILFELGLPVHLSGWMEYYAFHLAHPEMSHLELANNLNVGHSTVQRALAFMQQELL